MAKTPIDIKQVGGDVFGLDVSGSGNVIGKNIQYIVNKGNVIQIIDPSKEFLSNLEKIQTTLTEISSDNDTNNNKDGKSREELEVIEKRIDEILEMVKRIDNEKGVQTQELRAGQLQVSRVDLLLKRAIVLVEQADRYWNVVSSDSDINMYKSKHKEAYSLIQEANRLEPYNTEVLLYMAKIQCKLIPDNSSKMRKTLSHIQNLLAVPDNDTELFHLAEATFLLGTSSEPIDNESLEDARELFKKLGRRDWVRKCDGLLQGDNNNIVYAKVWSNRGVALANLGKYQQAIECFDKAIEINPNDVNIWNSKGTAFHYQSKYQQAIECFDKAIEINPNDADAWYNKGVALHYLTKHKDAIECYDKALTINPEQECSWYAKGSAFRKVGKYKEAIECYDKALTINPENAIAWYSKGLALHTLYGHKMAEECFNKAKELGLTV